MDFVMQRPPECFLLRRALGQAGTVRRGVVGHREAAGLQILLDRATQIGAPPLQAFLTVTLPAVMPGVITGSLIMFILAFNEFVVSLLLTDARIVTLPVLIYNYATRPQDEFQVLAAAGVVVMLVIVLAMNAFAIWLRNRYEQQW